VTAVFAADAVARLSGVVGVAAVTAGPGRLYDDDYNQKLITYLKRVIRRQIFGSMLQNIHFFRQKFFLE